MAMPIPRGLLIDSASVQEPDDSGDYPGSLSPAYTIKNVRLDAVQGEGGGWAYDYPQAGATLYIDATYSEPAKAPAMGSTVTVSRGSETYTGKVTGIRAPLDQMKVHHWEVALS